MTEYVSLDELTGTKAGTFICWPVYSEEGAEDRLRQLRGLGVEAVALGGRHGILGHMVLGKGHVGVVLRALWRGLEVALKTRRTDADRPSMMEEAEHLRQANEAGVGPRLYCFSRDFIVMELVEGPYFGEWAKAYDGEAERFISVVLDILRQVRNLDEAGLDHGELTRVRRHFIVSGRGPVIIDFESASTGRRVQNVTATVQSMFINRRFSPVIHGWFPGVNRDQLLVALRQYKAELSDESYGFVLDALGL
ncbi:MAG: serine/threonine protein kinase [Candidatus Bathyarchaeota archaeon]